MNQTETPFNHSFPFQTKCGWPACLVGVLNRTAFPLVVAVHNPDFGAEELHTYDVYGTRPATQEGGVFSGLDLVNIPQWNEDGTPNLKPTDFVHAVVIDELEPMDLERSANPFHYDLGRMGTPLTRGWTVMHEGFDSKDNPQPMHTIVLVNQRSGQRIVLSLSTKKEQQ